jgi:hypothetical protein
MKKLLLIISMLGISISINAQDISKELLQGKWLIVKVGDLYTKDLGLGEDIWDFRLNKWIVSSSGKELRPEVFAVKGNEIIFGSYRIKVIEFNKNKMVIDANGIKQTLEKIK